VAWHGQSITEAPRIPLNEHYSAEDLIRRAEKFARYDPQYIRLQVEPLKNVAKYKGGLIS
jgi:hypothetical protein